MNKYELTIVVDGDQEEAIRAFFAHNNWNFEKIGNYEDDAYIYQQLAFIYRYTTQSSVIYTSGQLIGVGSVRGIPCRV